MKIQCVCGAIISDTTDCLPYKAYFIPDQEWFGMWDAIDDAIEHSGPTPKDKETACMKLRSQGHGQQAWQCTNCGRLHVDDQQGNLHIFEPSSAQTSKTLFDTR